MCKHFTYYVNKKKDTRRRGKRRGKSSLVLFVVCKIWLKKILNEKKNLVKNSQDELDINPNSLMHDVCIRLERQ